MDITSMNDYDLRGFTCYWRVENFFLRYLLSNRKLESPTFTDNIYESSWSLFFMQKVPEFLGVFICKAQNPAVIHIHYSLSLLTGSGWKTIFKNEEDSVSPQHYYTGKFKFISWKKIIDEKWEYLPNGSLTISCKIWSDESVAKPAQCVMISRMTTNSQLLHMPTQYFTSLKPSDMLSFPVSYKLPVRKINQSEEKDSFKNTEDLLTFFMEKKFSFATLKTKNKEFIVHKAILCATSPVFHAMFERKMKETRSSIVEIDDIDSKTLSAMLQFLHLEPIDLKWDSAVKLYYAADKYQIEKLKGACVSQLIKELSNANICEALILADIHHDDELKSKALEYFCKHSKIVLQSQHWKDLLFHNTELASEILCEMAKNQ